jgi:hypothetical protein
MYLHIFGRYWAQINQKKCVDTLGVNLCRLQTVINKFHSQNVKQLGIFFQESNLL